jgi:hypothetical protein
MSSEPRVWALMLVHQKPALALRALRCFEAQTYPNKALVVMNTSPSPIPALDLAKFHHVPDDTRADHWRNIGWLRNHALSLNLINKPEDEDIVMHWDYDDWSHPDRMAIQVEHLLDTYASVGVVGYREMLFWKQTYTLQDKESEAWLYSNRDHSYCLGTSLCYRYGTWKRAPFPILKANRGTGEDRAFCKQHGSEGYDLSPGWPGIMIASQHGANTSTMVVPDSPSWSRQPAFDDYCRERMKL